MDTIPFGSTGRQTSRLGFGCSTVVSVGSRARALALLEAAYEEGIRHFDTAPLYGDGEAESLLGDFLARHRDECTVTTKFGVPPGRTSTTRKLAQIVLRPVLATFPGLKRRLVRSMASPAQPAKSVESPPNPIFNPAEAAASLDRSLRLLRVDRLDLWLLHEPRARDLLAPAAEGLLRVMEDAVTAGKIASFGAGSYWQDLPPIEQQLPAFTRVTQSDWSVLQPVIEPPNATFRIHYRALSANFAEVAERLRHDPAQCKAWSGEVGADLHDAQVVARLMLKAACVFHPASVILFSSKYAAHICSNAAAVADPSLAEPARRLYSLVQRELVR